MNVSPLAIALTIVTFFASASFAESARELKIGRFIRLTEPAEVTAVINHDTLRVTFVETRLVALVVESQHDDVNVGDVLQLGVVETMGSDRVLELDAADDADAIIRVVPKAELLAAHQSALEKHLSQRDEAGQMEVNQLRERIEKIRQPIEWRSGAHRCIAIFVSATSAHVTLRRQDGTLIRVPLERLDDRSRSRAIWYATTLGRSQRKLASL